MDDTLKTKCEDCTHCLNVTCDLGLKIFRQPASNYCNYFMSNTSVEKRPSGLLIFKDAMSKVKCLTCLHDRTSGCARQMPVWNKKNSKYCKQYTEMDLKKGRTPPKEDPPAHPDKPRVVGNDHMIALFYP